MSTISSKWRTNIQSFKIISPSRSSQDQSTRGGTPRNHCPVPSNTINAVSTTITKPKPTKESKLTMLFKLKIYLKGHPATALIDSGASCCFLSSKFVKQHNLHTQLNS